MTDIKNIFGNNVRKAREMQGLTQEKLSELIGIGVPALSNIECGKSYPTAETIEKIVKALKVEYYLLYINEEDYDLDIAYSEVLVGIERLKSNKLIFKRVYDFVKQLTKNL